MRKALLFLIAIAFVVSSGVGRTQGPKTLDIYYLDMEGGGGTLIVSPSGESLLVDAGNPGVRDAERVVAAAKAAGLKQVDYFVPTHYHGDHFGGLVDLAASFPVRTFVDIGSNPDQMNENAAAAFRGYTDARDKGRHIVVKPGDKLPIKGLDVTVVTARGETLRKPLAGGGTTNPLCNDFTPREKEQLGDQMSIGLAIQYGNFREVQLGDLTWNKEHDLVCPNNVIGTVDVFQTSAHGLALSSPKLLVHALRPRVVVMNNGAMKGASRETVATVRSSPRLEDLWLVHLAATRPGNKAMMETTDQGGKDVNPPERFIANLDEHKDDKATRATSIPGHVIQLSARQDGSFVVKNSRTGYSKEYKRR